MFPKSPDEMMPQMNAGIDPMMMQAALQARMQMQKQANAPVADNHAPDGPSIDGADPQQGAMGQEPAHIDLASLGMGEDDLIEDMLLQRLQTEGRNSEQFQEQAVAENMKNR